MKLLMPLSSWINRYTVTIFAFVLWIVLLDGKFSWVKQYKLRRQLVEMKQEKLDYLDKLASTKTEYENLISDKERYAREKYFISRPNEDVFIVD